MMYYIDWPTTYRAANRKCAEINEFVEQFKHCLIMDEISRDALISDIRFKVDELNIKYPKSKKLVVDVLIDNYIQCTPERRSYDNDTVFSIKFLPVRKTYRFAENANVLKEGGEK